MKKDYYHVILRIESDNGAWRMAFSDLSSRELLNKFVNPYNKGESFFVGNDLFSPYKLQSVRIIKTEHVEEVERESMNKKDLEMMNRINRENSTVVFISPGRGYRPEDIADVGEDMTHVFIKGEPGSKKGWWDSWKKVVGWVGGIIATVLAAGICKWLGWL